MKKDISIACVFLVIAVIGLIVVLKQPHAKYQGAANSPDPVRTPSPEEVAANNAIDEMMGRRWARTEAVSDMDGAKTVSLVRNASKDESGQTPAIVIRCGRKLEAFINLDQALAGGRDYGTDLYAVRIRFDESEPQRQHWNSSTDYHDLFAPNPRGFVQQLQKAKEFRFEYTPYQGSPDVATFSLSGLKEALAKEPGCKL